MFVIRAGHLRTLLSVAAAAEQPQKEFGGLKMKLEFSQLTRHR